MAAAWCAVALGCGTAVADPDSTAADAPTAVVATVGDTPIFRSELSEVVRRADRAALPADEAVPPSAADAGSLLLEAAAIEQLVDARLLRAEIERQGIVVTEGEVEERLRRLRQQLEARGLQWDAFLTQSGRDEGGVRQQVALEAALDKLIRTRLTADALARGYERHRRELDGTRLRVSHVVLLPMAALGNAGVSEALARMEEIRREVIQGKISFPDAARRYSDGPSRAGGGDLGWITRSGPLVDPFARQAYALAKGDVSPPFVTPFGVHIVQVADVDPGRLGFEAVRGKLESLLAGEMLRETLAQLRAKTPVKYAPGVAHFDPATPPGSGRRRIVTGP